ncbi:MAG TPA: VOC family protein [Candidatus Angelobacter sp.]|jgi:catechol 2,3-dioxygenase-like lactoylglutathione lyase family enzyme|nr:VOC family protein [Candidatus Angelobacter sp.]
MEYKKITPNLIVKDVSASLKFYSEVLSLPAAITVPEQPPFVFASVTAGGIEIFFNQQENVAAEPTEFAKEFAARPLGGSFTMFIEVEGIEEILARVQQHKARIVMPLQEMFYGMKEFAFLDPDGYIITIAERIG